jgi:hypothetical protein
MMMMRRCSALLLAFLAAACGAGDEAGDVPQPADSVLASQPAPAAPPVDSVMSAVPAAPAAAATPRDTMLTPWRAVGFPSEPWEQSAATLEALLQRVRDVVAAQLEEPDAAVLPTRMESQSADSAVGILVHPDQADDSVRDVEFRLHMRREGAEWRVTGVDRRERCRRGVAAGGLCA